MSNSILSPISKCNVEFLSFVRDFCRKERDASIWIFGIDEITVDTYAALDDIEIISLSTELDMALITPRFNGDGLKRLIAAPAKSRGIFAAVLDPVFNQAKAN